MNSIKPVERNLYLDTTTGFYIVRKFKKGKKPLWETTGEKTIKAARSRKDAIISRWLVDRPKSARHLFSELFDEVKSIKRTKQWKTALSAESQIDLNLKPWFDQKCPFIDLFNESVWETYIVDQRIRKPSRRLKHDREILVYTLGLATKKGWIQKRFSLRKPDAKKQVGKYYDDDEISRLLSHCPSEALHLQILIAVKMGMRLSEILHLSWDRVDLKDGVIILRPEDTKTKRKRFVPIHDDLLPLLRSRSVEIAHKTIFVFPSPRSMNRPVDTNQSAWRKAKLKAKVLGRFHDLRHRALTDMLAGGISETDVSKITGASSEVIRSVYHHLRTDVMDRIRSLNCGKFVTGNKK